jgi:hypothetical protein
MDLVPEFDLVAALAVRESVEPELLDSASPRDSTLQFPLPLVCAVVNDVCERRCALAQTNTALSNPEQM